MKYQISWISIRLGAELFRAGEQTDKHDEGNSRFSKYWGTRLKTESKWNYNTIIFFGYKNKIHENCMVMGTWIGRNM